MADDPSAAKPRPKPPVGRRFQPGQSGNPGGRPKVPPEVLEELKGPLLGLSLKAIRRILRTPRHPQHATVAMWNVDKVTGKAPTTTALTGADGQPLIPASTTTTGDTLAAVIARLAAPGNEPKAPEASGDTRAEIAVPSAAADPARAS